MTSQIRLCKKHTKTCKNCKHNKKNVCTADDFCRRGYDYPDMWEEKVKK